MSSYKYAGLSCLAACMVIVACSWGNDDDDQTQSPSTPTPITPDQPTVVQNPPLLQKNADGRLELIVAYKKNRLYNPNTQKWDDVLLRGYLNHPQDFAHKKTGDAVEDVLVGPQIRAKQGETIALTLNNQLPQESTTTCAHHIENVNEPHCFNTTNLHTHGLWISPQGKSDNVFLKINSNEKFEHEFKIDPNHPAGTFWYHSHVHGSTALQVSSGMAGALIIEGSRLPQISNGEIQKTGDLDILWKDNKTNRYPNEKVMVFQQIHYSCDEESTPASSSNTEQNCNGKVEDYVKIGAPAAWGNDQRYTSINGKILGEIKVTQNEFFRWRMIHAGIRDTLGLVIKELPDSEQYTAEQTLQACQSYQDESQRDAFMQLKTLPMHTLAQDGLTMNALQTRGLSVFQPGYRHDAMLAFPTTNKYCVYDTKLNQDDQINAPMFLQLPSNSKVNAQLLAWVNVTGSTRPTQTPMAFLQQQAEKLKLPKQIIDQLAQGNLAAFASHPTLISPSVDRMITPDSKQFTGFGVSNGKFGVKHQEDGPLISFGDHFTGQGAINGQYVRQLKIGHIDEWEITSVSGGHPFHIHVNPFQIVKILDQDGNDVSGLGTESIDYNADGSVDVQYRGLKGAWKDTLFVKNGYRVIARSKYEKFEGDFVLHCHILDHEDKGMMEIVRICGDQYPCDSELPTHHH